MFTRCRNSRHRGQCLFHRRRELTFESTDFLSGRVRPPSLVSFPFGWLTLPRLRWRARKQRPICVWNLRFLFGCRELISELSPTSCSSCSNASAEFESNKHGAWAVLYNCEHWVSKFEELGIGSVGRLGSGFGKVLDICVRLISNFIKIRQKYNSLKINRTPLYFFARLTTSPKIFTSSSAALTVYCTKFFDCFFYRRFYTWILCIVSRTPFYTVWNKGYQRWSVYQTICKIYDFAIYQKFAPYY